VNAARPPAQGGAVGAAGRLVVRARAIPPTAADALLALVVCALDVLLFSELVGGGSGAADQRVAPAGVIVAYAVAGNAALCWRRRAPLATFGVLWAHALAAMLVPGYRPTLGLLVALYTVAGRRGRWTALGALVAVLVTSGVTVAYEAGAVPDDVREQTVLANAAFFAFVDVVVYGIGRWVHANRLRAREQDRRRLAAAREAVAAERARIARELHDIVASAVTVMVLQAAGARRLARADPGRAEADEPLDQRERVLHALGQIEEVGTQATGELRRLLGALGGGGAGRGGAEDAAAQPGLATLDGLLARVRDAGVPVRVEHEGEPARLDRSVDLAAYRVVQEALTNVARHAGRGATATVRLSWGDSLTVRVADDGGGAPRAASPHSTGHGLLGLGERVALVGGSLDAAPEPGGGFTLTATLPVAAAVPGPPPAGDEPTGERGRVLAGPGPTAGGADDHPGAPGR
jgi:signal transduction histidine kinase